MKHFLVALSCCLTLLVTACGGGGGGGGADSGAVVVPPVSSGPALLTISNPVTGTGTLAALGNNLTVHYTGYLYNPNVANFQGTRFDSSVGGQPFTFRLGAGQVIAGWDQGLVGMRVGGKRTLLIPSSLGYGAAGRGTIPPNAGLVFDVELLAVQ